VDTGLITNERYAHLQISVRTDSIRQKKNRATKKIPNTHEDGTNLDGLCLVADYYYYYYYHHHHRVIGL